MRWLSEVQWLDELRYRRRKRQRDRRKAEIIAAICGVPPTRRVTGRMMRMLKGDR